MGYFRQPVRRSEARAAKQSFMEVARGVDFGPWQRCTRTALADRDRFLRFVVERPDAGRIGLFRASDSLDENEDLPPAARSTLRRVLRWFNANLPVPRRLPKTAICWFRADAIESISRVRTLIEVYRLVDIPVLMQATAAPGRIVHCDRYQVAAVPYADRRTTSSVM